MVVDLAALVQDTSRLDLLPVSFDAGRLFATRIGIGVAEKAAAFRVRYAVLDELASVDDARTMIPALLSQILTLGIELLNREWRAPWQAASAETWASAFETMRDSAAVADASLFLATMLSLVPEPVLHLATDVGMVRKGNEDFGRIAVDHSTRPGASAVQAWVADGMGGHAAGEVASRLAVASLERTLRDWRESVAAGGNVLRSHIERAFARANTAIFRDMEMNPSRRGMGTTLTGILALSPHPAPDPGATRAGAFDAARVWCANIGDSRTYLVSGSTLVRLSHDHSFVQSLVDAGEITEDETFRHPAKNVIARCLGGQGEIDGTPDICTLAAGSGDLFLIASDGLTDLIEDSDILEIMKFNWDAAEPSLPLVAQALIDAANDEGGKDNITVALVYFA
jgi:protein phosphatase